MSSVAAQTGAAVGGAAAGWLTDSGLRRTSRPSVSSELVLIGAALVYPAASRGGSRGLVLRREVATLGATVAVTAAAAVAPDRRSRAVVAAGWILHAVFDGVHVMSPASRLPHWYPAFCAGYDLAMAAGLSRRSSAT